MPLKIKVCWQKEDGTKVWREVSKSPFLRIGYKNSYGWTIVALSDEFKTVESEEERLLYVNEMITKNIRKNNRKRMFQDIKFYAINSLLVCFLLKNILDYTPKLRKK